jgi:hypothetical protein
MVLGPAGESRNLRNADFVTADCAVADILFIYKKKKRYTKKRKRNFLKIFSLLKRVNYKSFK